MTNQENFQIKEKSSLHNYRTELPNIIFELNLDPYELALYCYFKKVAGDNGACFQTNKTISEKTRICLTTLKDRKNSLSQPRDQLGGKSLITCTERKTKLGDPDSTLIEINDIWPDNFKIMSSRFSGDRGVSRDASEGRSPHDHKEDPSIKIPKEQLQAEPAAVVSFGCLDKIDIPQKEKKWIVDNYTTKEINNALDYVNNPEFKIKKTFIQALKWALESKPEPHKKSCDLISENSAIAKKYEFLTSPYATIHVLSKFVEFTKQKCSSYFYSITYDNQNFEQLLISKLKELRFNIKGNV